MLLFTSTRHLSLKNTKKLSFVQMSAYSKLNYTYWINNFLSNKCFNEQLPSPKRNADKLYSESFLKFLLEKSYVYNVSNLMGFIQFNQKNKNLITASYNWSDFVKTIRLVNLNNAVIALPIFFNLKNYIFYLHKICFYNYITLILTKNYKLKSFARIAQSRVTFLSYFFYKWPYTSFYYQVLFTNCFTSCNTLITKILIFYWYLYNQVIYNKVLFYRKLVFNYFYYYKSLSKKHLPGPFLVPYSTLTVRELLYFSNTISSSLLNHLRLSSKLHQNLAWFFKFAYGLFTHNRLYLFYFSSVSKYQKECYNYFLSSNNSFLESSENFLINFSSKFNVLFSSIYANYIAISYSFINKSISFFTDSFYFYFQKFTKYFLFQGKSIAAFSKVLLFFNRLLRLNSTQPFGNIVYFSDAFSPYLPSIILTTKLVSKGSSRSISVPKLLKTTKRIPKAMQCFTLNIKQRKETILVQRLFLEFTDLLDFRGETIKSFIDTYKGALVNLQFSQSLMRSFFFEYRSRVYPTIVSKTRKRVRLENQLNYF